MAGVVLARRDNDELRQTESNGSRWNEKRSSKRGSGSADDAEEEEDRVLIDLSPDDSKDTQSLQQQKKL